MTYLNTLARAPKLSRFHSRHTLGALALAVAALALGGCSSSGSLTLDDGSGTSTAGNGTGTGNGGAGGDGAGNGNGNGNGGDGTGGDGTGGAGGGATPLARVVNEQGQSTGNLGSAVSTLANGVGNIVRPVTGDASASQVTGGVDNAGGTVQALGTALKDGLGQIGSSRNPVGDTLSGLSNVVDGVGKTVSSTGNAVDELDKGPLNPLSPITDPVGELVNRTGQAVSRVGGAWEGQMEGGTAQRVTMGVSRVVQPVLGAVTEITQNVGEGTGLGDPLKNGVLDPLAREVGKAGTQLTGSGSPIQREIGGVLVNTGETLGYTGMAVTDPASGPNDGSAVRRVANGAVTAIQPLTGGLLQTTQGLGEATRLGQPVDNLLTRVGGTVQALGTGITGNGQTPVIAQTGSVVNATGGLVSGLGGAVNSPAGSGPAAGTGSGAGGILAPLTHTLGGLLGGLRR